MNGPEDRHESYAMACFSRVSCGGTGASLYGSEFRHSHFITLSICRGSRQFDLGRQWYHAGQELIEIAVSESQFCELITRMNIGGGVPVTLARFEGKCIPPPPQPGNLQQQYREAVAEDVQEALDAMQKARAIVDELIAQPSKTKARELAEHLRVCDHRLTGSVPFVAKQFAERMEQTVASAKTEIEAHLSATAMRLGTEEMRRQFAHEAPKLIEEAK